MLIGNYFKKIHTKYKKHFFTGLSCNSLISKKNNIFFAIKGLENDGNKFIKNAIKNGARTIVSTQKFEGIKGDVLYIKTKNVRKLLAEISFRIYKNKPKNLIAVTGTNGKSSVADFYFQILKFNNKKVASIGTLGIKSIKNTIPVSNTTLDPINLGYHLEKLKKKKIDNVILEASSHGLKQNRLDGLVFQTGIFTNLSHDHLDFHKSIKNYLNAKLHLFKKLLNKKSTIIADSTIPEFKIIKNISLRKKLDIKTLFGKKSNLFIITHKYYNDKQFIEIKYKKKIYSFKINLIGKIQIKNLLMAMIAAEKSGLDFKKIIKISDKIKPVHGRLEKIGSLKNNSQVILDYAHTPDALKVCLSSLKDQFKSKKISIVFGCGGNRDNFKRSKMGEIANDFCNKIYLTDDNPRNENPKKIRTNIKKKINKLKLYEIPSREKAIAEAIKNIRSGEILVIAGKGHERIQDYGDYKKFFSDKNIVQKCIKIKNKNLSKNLKLNILQELVKKNYINLKTKTRNASINSKEIKKNDIFFAIKGKNEDGNNFVRHAFKKGAALAVVNKFDKSRSKLRQIKVLNSLKLLTRASSIVRENANGKIIAITGSCGKTSLKELLSKTLGKFSKVTHSPKSFNNKFGVPLSLFNLDPDHDFGVFEIGMDKKGEIDDLSSVIKPDVGVITNISYAHAKNFKNIKEIAMAKAEIIQNINKDGYLVLNHDDQFYKLHHRIALNKKLKIFTFSMKKNSANVKVNYIKKIKSKFEISVTVDSKIKSFFISSNFESNIQNLLAAITIISIFKDIKKLHKNIFFDFKIPEGRGDISKIKIKNKNIYLIDESYNSNPLSLKSAIKNFDLIPSKNAKKYLILGDMLELGKYSKKLHKNLSYCINSSSIDSVSVLGNDINETYKNIDNNKKGLILSKKSEIINLIKNNINNNDYLMIKGSNSTGLNIFVNLLKKGNFNAI